MAADNTLPKCSNRVEKLTCTICLELFRSPRLLPCHHTFCLVCIQDLASRHSNHGNTTFPCPSCRKPASLPTGGVTEFQFNFYIEDDLLEAQRAASAQDQPGTLSSLSKKETRKTKSAADQEKEIQRLRQDLEQSQRLSKSAKKAQERKRQQLVDKIKQLEEDLAQHKGRALELLEDNQRQANVLEEKEQEREKTERRVKKLEKHAREAERQKLQIKELEQQNDCLQTQNESLRTTEKSLSERVQELERYSHDLSARAGDLNRMDIDEAQADWENLRIIQEHAVGSRRRKNRLALDSPLVSVESEFSSRHRVRRGRGWGLPTVGQRVTPGSRPQWEEFEDVISLLFIVFLFFMVFICVT